MTKLSVLTNADETKFVAVLGELTNGAPAVGGGIAEGCVLSDCVDEVVTALKEHGPAIFLFHGGALNYTALKAAGELQVVDTLELDDPNGDIAGFAAESVAEHGQQDSEPEPVVEAPESPVFELGARVYSNIFESAGTVVAREDSGILGGYDCAEVRDRAETTLDDGNDFLVLHDNDRDLYYGYDGDGDYERLGE